VPVMLHFGDSDQSIPMSDVETVRQARPDVTTYVYKAGHGFSCDERQSYNAEASNLALERTLKFFRENIG
jgi:carboxymethylenebutenolidase